MVDIVGSLLLLVTLSPLIAVLVALIALDGGSPFYSHVRVGHLARPFRCWKLRTMVEDASERLAEILRDDPEAAAEWVRSYKLKDDPRVTPIGRILRRTSLDELPQLWNVLVGEMSLVGPRPITREELARYGRTARHYCSVRPGLTGLWQVQGRNEIPYARRVVLDRHYVRTRSALGDLRVLAMTISTVVRVNGR